LAGKCRKRPEFAYCFNMTPVPVSLAAPVRRTPAAPPVPGWLLSLGLCLLAAPVTAQGLAQPADARGTGAAGPGAAAAELPAPATRVYRYLSGATPSFSDRPPAHDNYVVLSYGCYACNPQSPVDWKVTRLYREAYASEIEQAALVYNVDPALVRAVIHAESGFNVHARSPKGAIGLMQLMPATARALGVADPSHPHQNIRGGVRYLAEMLARFRSDITLATAAYNAGPQAVQKYAGVPPYAETRVYVQRVRILHQRYKGRPQG
jgi:soluble lytic murein transglycosylase-like protein